MAAVFLVFGGSLIGSVWMMSVFGLTVLPFYRVFPFHAVLQMDGFLTLLIMGIGYMIVPRFRNVVLPSSKLAYASLLLVLFSIAASMVSDSLAISGDLARLAGVSIFAGIVLWMLRIHPKLLRLSDYFTGLSVVLLAALAVIRFALAEQGNLTEVQMLLLFPILMIFGVEYKTLPSFLGFIRPRKKLAVSSFGLVAAAVALGIASISFGGHTLLDLAFNVAFLASAILFAGSLFIFGGFDNREILALISGEKKARYVYTVWYTRLSFVFLYASTILAICFHAFPGAYPYFFDLAVHYAAIGFIGITISLYLPLMLPPITGRTVHFVRFNHAPILLIVSALLMRAAGDIAMASGALEPPASFPFAVSGWLVVAALSVFIVMVHRSMKGLNQIDVST